jgi:solute:Na+ symporter, SSS family
LNLYLTILILYSTLLIVVGLLASRLTRQSSDFFVAGRRLGNGLLFSTLLAANIGAGSTVGAAGLGYERGLSAWWWVGSAGIGSLLLAFTVGPRLWSLASLNNFYTVGDYLEFRYDRRIRVLSAGLLWLGALAILAGQLIAFAWILGVVAHTSKWVGCLLGGLVVTLYSSLGGLVSVARVNVLQLVVKAVGFLVAVPFALRATESLSHLHWSRSYFQIVDVPPAYWSFKGDGLADILSYMMLLVPSFIVSPGLLQKIYGARSGSVVRVGVSLNALSLLAFAILPPVLGMLTRQAYPNLGNRELALPTLMVNLLPPWLGLLTLAAVLSAEMSSADAVQSMLTNSFTKDFLKGLLRPNLSEARLLYITKLTSVTTGMLGIIVALLIPSVVAALQIFYSLLTVALFVPLVVGLYWKRPNALAALLAISVSVPAALLIHIQTAGRGFGVISPVACGILISAGSMTAVTFVSSARSPMR